MAVWFDATKWQPWQFKLPAVPYVHPVDTSQAFKTPAAAPPGPNPLWASPKPVSASQNPFLAALQPAPALWVDDGRELILSAPAPPPVIPGLTGDLVQHCWNSAKWQIAEVAVASALATMSLLCSRTYRHGSLGLSLYILLIGKTSTGKSFGFTANDLWWNELQKQFEGVKPPHSEEAKRRLTAVKNMIIGEIGSAQGLAQHFAKSAATLVHADEFVDHIKLMAQPNPPAQIAQMRAELLRLIEMSGPGRTYRGRKYSSRSNQQEEVDVFMASLTILATGTPQAFYDDMSSSLLTSGFLPRFTILEHKGDLSAPNPNQSFSVSKDMMKKITNLFNQQYERGQSLTGELSQIIDVPFKDQLAENRMFRFENFCLGSVKDSNQRDLPTSGLWSRAKDHVKQIASLIAIGVNPYKPEIELNHVDIAINIVLPNVTKLSDKVAAGEVGMSDDRRISEIKRFMAKMYLGGYESFKHYAGLSPDLINSGVIQIFLVRSYCKRLAAFRNHPLGSTRAFNDALNDMVKYKEIELVDGKGMCCKLNIDSFADVLLNETNNPE